MQSVNKRCCAYRTETDSIQPHALFVVFTLPQVSLVLHGEEGMSETRELTSENEQPLFERNSRDTFILTLVDIVCW